MGYVITIIIYSMQQHKPKNKTPDARCTGGFIFIPL